MVSKVASGHNCWLTSDVACADIITTYIGNWAGAAASGAGRQILLVPPAQLLDPQDSRSFPQDPTLFETTVRQYFSWSLTSVGVHIRR